MGVLHAYVCGLCTHQRLSHAERERRQAVNIISGLQAGVHCLSQQIETVLYGRPLCQLKISCSERDFITFIQSGKKERKIATLEMCMHKLL